MEISEQQLFGWTDATILMHKGYFMAAEHFSPDQSIHYYHGEYYLEDGAVINYENMFNIEWVTESKYYILALPKDINKEEYDRLHEIQSHTRSMIDGINESYQKCFTRSKDINYEDIRLLISADPINMGRVISND